MLVKKDAFLPIEPPEIGGVLRGIVTGLRCRAFEWIAGIEGVGVASHENLAVKLIRSRFRQDFNPPVSEFVVFRGVGVLIDSILADGGFWRKLAGGDAINVVMSDVSNGGGCWASL